jgi:hypothetical protein
MITLSFSVEVPLSDSPFVQGALANKNGIGIEKNPHFFDADARYDWTQGWIDAFTSK